MCGHGGSDDGDDEEEVEKWDVRIQQRRAESKLFHNKTSF